MRFAVVACVLAMATYASAECANACSGHGTCGSSDQCDCFPNYSAADCSERVCPYGLAWVDSPRGDLNHDGVVSADTNSNAVPIASFGTKVVYEYENFANHPASGKVASQADEGHFYSECSNKGLCDRVTAECVCYDGYTGSSCQRTICPSDCSGHGVCRTVEEIIAGGLTDTKIDNAGGDTFWSGSQKGSGRENLQYRLWDMDMAQACVCDPGYSGADCTRRECPRGDDPLTHRAADCGGFPCNVEMQSIVYTPTNAETSDWIYLSFQDWTGKIWRTDYLHIAIGATPGTPICSSATVFADSDACATKFEEALQAIPNGVLGGIDVACVAGGTSLTLTITFTAKPGNVEKIMVNRSPALTARLNGDMACAEAKAAIISTAGDSISGETRRGNEEESTCSNRGVCDYDTGICKCFKGYTMDDCSMQNALAQ